MTNNEQGHSIGGLFAWIKFFLADDYDFEYIGIRVQTELFGAQVGNELTHQSSVWDDGNMLDEQLNGVCAIDAKTAHRLNPVTWEGYEGKIIVILGSNRAQCGEDAEEIIMSEPVVLAVIEA